MQRETESGRQTVKQTQNRRDYAARKADGDQVLLRLERGGAAALDAAAKSAGLSRTSFARHFLVPLATSMGAHFAMVDQARRERGLSIVQFIDRALVRAAVDLPAPPTCEAAREFDQIFLGSPPVDDAADVAREQSDPAPKARARGK